MDAVVGILPRHRGDEVLIVRPRHVLTDERRSDVVADPHRRLTAAGPALHPRASEFAEQVLGPDHLVQRRLIKAEQ